MNKRFKKSLVCLAYSYAIGVSAQAINEPADGNLYLGALLDTSVAGGDSPVAFNQRMGFGASVFGFTQTIPLSPFNASTGLGGQMNASMVELTGTNAMIFLTVVPYYPDFTQIQTSDYRDLGNQIATYMAAPFNRKVFLRFAPNMNTPNVLYGLQPTEFVTAFQTMYTTVKAIAPNVAIVWSPGCGEGYPFGIALGSIKSAADKAALDTDGNNQLNALDDPYKGYYPGDNFVDWNAISYYYLGQSQPFNKNTPELTGTVGGGLTGFSQLSLNGGLVINYFNFYSTYCASKNKPCALSESGAAYHVNTTITGGSSQSDIQGAWFGDALTNTTFLSTFPKIKMINLYEFQVVQDSFYDLRDFRISMDPTTRTNFLNAFPGVAGNYLLAASTPIPSDLSGAGPQNSGIVNGTSTVSKLPGQTLQPNVFSAAVTQFGILRWSVVVGGVLTGLILGLNL